MMVEQVLSVCRVGEAQSHLSSIWISYTESLKSGVIRLFLACEIYGLVSESGTLI